MEGIFHFLKQTVTFLLSFLDPNWLEAMLRAWGWLGYPILFGVVFAETGLLAGFFFPGDSLLFIAGFVASAGALDIYWLIPLLIVAAVAGDATGYHLGKKTGPRIFNREDSLFFHKSHLERTQKFYEQHGGKTIVLARFIPILRTFAPFVAGMGKMTYRRFALFNVFGGIGWVVTMTLAGYFLGNLPIVRENFEASVLAMIFISILPVVWHALRRN